MEKGSCLPGWLANMIESLPPAPSLSEEAMQHLSSPFIKVSPEIDEKLDAGPPEIMYRPQLKGGS